MTYTNNLRQFAGKTLKVTEVYPRYRAGGVELNGKFIFKQYKEFPITADEVVTTGGKLIEGEKTEWREQVWLDGKPTFHKLPAGTDFKEFYKIYKKVFDISVELESPMTIIRYKDVTEEGDRAIIQGVSGSKIKSMLEMLTDFEPPMIEGKLRDGTAGQVPAFDYEDKAKDLLAGVSFSMKITGVGLETSYVYKNKPFNKPLEAAEFEDLTSMF